MSNLRKFDPDEDELIAELATQAKKDPRMQVHHDVAIKAIRRGWFDSKLESMGNVRAYKSFLKTHSDNGAHVHIDLNDFGQINKDHGNPVGDEALYDFERIVTPLVKKYKGKSHRYGGDEFGTWFETPEQAHMFVRELKHGLDSANDIRKFGVAGTGKPAYNLAASIGIGHTPEHAEQSLIHVKKSLGAKVLEPHPVSGQLVETAKRVNYHKPGEAPTVYYSGIAEHGHMSPHAPQSALPHSGKAPSLSVSSFPGKTQSEEIGKSEKSLDPVSEVISNPSHPILGNGTYGIVTAEDPRVPSQDRGGNESLENAIRLKGYHFEKIRGRYDKPRPTPHENGFLVHGAKEEDLVDWGKRFGQESVIYSNAGQHKMIYTNGDKAGLYNPGEGMVIHPEEPVDYYSTFIYRGEPVHATLNFDFDKLLQRL